jgi:hypothetical protein
MRILTDRLKDPGGSWEESVTSCSGRVACWYLGAIEDVMISLSFS